MQILKLLVELVFPDQFLLPYFRRIILTRLYARKSNESQLVLVSTELFMAYAWIAAVDFV